MRHGCSPHLFTVSSTGRPSRSVMPETRAAHLQGRSFALTKTTGPRNRSSEALSISYRSESATAVEPRLAAGGPGPQVADIRVEVALDHLVVADPVPVAGAVGSVGER